MPSRGVQYVVGQPPQSPVLRPLRQKMYDREPVWGGQKETTFFVDNKRTSDGRSKDASFTNMTQCGSLGFPLEYDLASIAIMPASGTPEYADQYEQFVWSDSVFEWIFGGGTRWKTFPLTLMEIRRVAEQYVKDVVTGKDHRLIVKNGRIVAEALDPKVTATPMLAAPGLGNRLLMRYASMLTPDKKPRRITSTECFSGKIKSHTRGERGKEMDVFMAMEGILYAQI